MKILHVMQEFHNGGTEILVADLMNAQVAEGHRVTLLIWGGHKVINAEALKAVSSAVKIVTFGRDRSTRNPLRRNILPLLRFNLWLATHRADILHVHHISTCKGVRLFPRRRSLMTLHYTLSPLEPTDRVGHIAAISKSVAKYVSDNCHREAEVVYNGIPFAATEKTDYTPGKPFRIAVIARLHAAMKGQDIAIEAISKLKQRGVKGVELHLFGDGEDEAKLRELADKLGVADAVKWHGWVSRADVAEALPSFDLYVHPSRNEPFGLAVVEAMAAGVPVVASDIDGPAEIICGGEYGRMFASGNAESLADAIAATISDYPAAADMARRARNHARSTFSVAAMAARYQDIYRRILSKSR